MLPNILAVLFAAPVLPLIAVADNLTGVMLLGAPLATAWYCGTPRGRAWRMLVATVAIYGVMLLLVLVRDWLRS